KLWGRSLVEKVILERLMQRWAMAGGRDNLLACADLLKLAPEAKYRVVLLNGLEKGFAGRSASDVPDELRQAVLKAWGKDGGASSLTLGLRLGHEPAVARALKFVADEKANRDVRLACIRILGEVEQKSSVPVLLSVLEKSPPGPRPPPGPRGPAALLRRADREESPVAVPGEAARGRRRPSRRPGPARQPPGVVAGAAEGDRREEDRPAPAPARRRAEDAA